MQGGRLVGGISMDSRLFSVECVAQRRMPVINRRTRAGLTERSPQQRVEAALPAAERTTVTTHHRRPTRSALQWSSDTSSVLRANIKLRLTDIVHMDIDFFFLFFSFIVHDLIEKRSRFFFFPSFWSDTRRIPRARVQLRRTVLASH